MLIRSDACITSMELFVINVPVTSHFSSTTWSSRQHAILKVASGIQIGWGEALISVNTPREDGTNWGKLISELRGQTISEALARVPGRLRAWGAKCCEMVELALVDLAGKVSGRSALELLGLPGRESIPGLFCILDSDPNAVARKSQDAMARGLGGHVKLKLFGENELDLRIISAARSVLGRSMFLMGDANYGYRPDMSAEPLDAMASSLVRLSGEGLDACEDPANMTTEQWIALQSRVGALTLIPDVPLRPAAEAINWVTPGMGRSYNIHPGCTGSVIASVRLAEKIKAMGGGLMVGDDSLIGPACTAWQQLAIGMQADFVEALEKPQDSTAFLNAMINRPTRQGADGRIQIDMQVRGFGLEVDVSVLTKSATSRLTLPTD